MSYYDIPPIIMLNKGLVALVAEVYYMEGDDAGFKAFEYTVDEICSDPVERTAFFGQVTKLLGRAYHVKESRQYEW